MIKRTTGLPGFFVSDILDTEIHYANVFERDNLDTPHRLLIVSKILYGFLNTAPQPVCTILSVSNLSQACASETQLTQVSNQLEAR